MKAMNIGYHDDPTTGYGRFGIKLHDELVKQGVADYGPIGVNAETLPPTGIAPVALHLSTPPHVTGWYEGQLGSIFTMWEFTELPNGFRENVPEFHRIIVPCLQNQELYSQFNADVRVVPLAVGPEWNYRPRIDPSARFDFLTGGAGPRKGCPDVVRAFNRVFRGWTPKMGPEPHLTVRAKSTQNAEIAPSPRITVIAQPLPGMAEIELYAAAHCYVSGSQGEGWGLMPHQAIAQGCPTILSNHSGQGMFAHYGIPIGWKLQKLNDYSTHWGDPGSAWIPDFDEMCEKMREVYDNYAYHADRAAINAALIAEEFSWERTAREVIENLPECDESFTVSSEFHKMPQRLYEVRVKAHSTWSINGRAHTYDPGNTYYETWDMKERLASRGDLTADCIDPLEMGYTEPPELPQLRCPHCNQRYGVDESLLPENLVGASGNIL